MYSFNKVYEMLNSEDKFKFDENNLNLEFKKIEFSNVEFRYPNSAINIFDNINLDINKGDKIGVFGDSGSGKVLC